MIESEKLLETKLKNGTEKMGGWCIKMLSTHLTGLPDRVCLFPGGIIFFAEIKTTKKKVWFLIIFDLLKPLEELIIFFYIYYNTVKIEYFPKYWKEKKCKKNIIK